MTPFIVSFSRIVLKALPDGGKTFPFAKTVGSTVVDAVDRDQAEELAREQLPVRDSDVAHVEPLVSMVEVAA